MLESLTYTFKKYAPYRIHIISPTKILNGINASNRSTNNIRKYTLPSVSGPWYKEGKNPLVKNVFLAKILYKLHTQ